MFPDRSNIIRVFLADDHPTLRLGLRMLLEQANGISVVGESGDGQDAIAQISRLLPDVAVIDCQLPGLDGVQVAVEIRRQKIPTKVLALSSYSEEHYIRGMLEAGAVGYLLKDEAPSRIIDAVRAAAIGAGSFSPKIVAQISELEHYQNRKKFAVLLTERERQIVDRIVQGKTNKQIARELEISSKGVEKHISAIFEKWKVNSRAEIAVRAVRENFGGESPT